MAKALIVGANGWIGNAVAQAFRREGYHVFGLVRSAEKGAYLWKQEIEPVVGDITKPETYEQYVKQSSVIIDTSSPDRSSTGSATLLQVVKQHATVSTRKHLFFTSGILVHGSNDNVVDEATPNNPGFLKWRTDQEEAVLAATRVGLATTVIRPGFCFGGQTGTHLNGLFGVDKEIVIAGNPQRRNSWIHVDDLAAAYVAAATHSAAAAGQVFDIARPQAETWEELAKKAAAAAGKPDLPLKVVKAEGWAAIADATVLVTPAKAEQLLGWRAKHLDLSQQLPLAFRAWKAIHNK